MKYDHAKPLIKELMHIAVLYHMSPGMLRTKIFDALKEFIPDMDDGCFERGCPAIDYFAVHASDISQERVDETQKSVRGNQKYPQESVDETPPCKTHPDAPHGFDRNASHSADRYVCECEGWEPQPEPPPECQTEEEKTAFAFGWWKAMETKRQWVGLTDEEIKDIREDLTYDDEDFNELEFARDIEAKLKEKNGG